MKRLLLAVCTLMIAFVSFAQEKQGNGTKEGIIWESGTLSQALKKAKQENKPVFLDCYATWCGPCKYMANTVFTTKEAGDYFNRKFVNIKIDMEKGEGVNLSKEFKIKGYPTFIILDPNGKEIGRIVGGAPIGQFIKKVESFTAIGQ